MGNANYCKRNDSVDNMMLPLTKTIIIKCDKNQKIVQCNDFGYHILKYEPKTLLNYHVSVLMSDFMKHIHQHIFKNMKKKYFLLNENGKEYRHVMTRQI